MRIANTVNDSIVDGPGLRFTICSHGCPGCHNPGTHDPSGGEEATVEALAAQFQANPLLDGVTLSGGEPFAQAADCAQVARRAHQAGLNVWTYTGYLFEAIQAKGDPAWEALLRETDVLVDGPFLLGEKTYGLPFRGSRNQRLIRVAESLQRGQVVLWESTDPLAKFTVPES